MSRLLLRISFVPSLSCSQVPTLNITVQCLVFLLGSALCLVFLGGGGGLGGSEETLLFSIYRYLVGDRERVTKR